MDLFGQSSEMQHSLPVDVVLGLTETSSTGHSISGLSSPGSSAPNLTPNALFNTPNGLYLLGLRAGRALMLGAHQLTSSVEWATSTTGTRLWANLSRCFADWNVVFMRARLKEVSLFRLIPIVFALLPALPTNYALLGRSTLIAEISSRLFICQSGPCFWYSVVLLMLWCWKCIILATCNNDWSCPKSNRWILHGFWIVSGAVFSV